jgi:hypothetical protein
MTGRVRLTTTTTTLAVSAAVGLVMAVAFVEIGHVYPLPVMIGVLPGRMAVALGLGAALAVTAARSLRSSHKPALSMPRTALFQLLAWWILAAFALALVASAAWRVWGVLFLFGAIAATVKAISVFSYIKQEYQFRLWMPFAAIFGLVFFMIGFGLFVARSNTPPPVTAALSAYRSTAEAGRTASRAAPDLSSAGFTLDIGADVDLGGLPATFFSYHAANGTRVDLYMADYGFPRPPGSSPLDDPPGWSAKMDELHLRGGSAPGAFMVVGSRDRLVLRFAQALAHAG